MTDRRGPIQFRNEGLRPAIQARAREWEGLGSVASRDLERYYEVLRRSLLPRFTRAEATVILVACDTAVAWQPAMIDLLWANVARAEQAARDLGVDPEALSRRIEGLEYAEVVAIVDAAERYRIRARTDPSLPVEESGLVMAKGRP